MSQRSRTNGLANEEDQQYNKLKLHDGALTRVGRICIEAIDRCNSSNITQM